MLASILCLGGVFFMQDVSANSLKQTNFLAMFFGILCALTQAGKNTLSSSLTTKHHSLPNLFVVAVSMIIGSLIMFLFVSRDSLNILNMNQLSVLIFLGVFTIAIPAAINIHAFRATGNMGAVTYFSFLLPVLGATAAYFINDERGFDYFKLGLSFAVISAGIYFINKK